MDVSQRKIKKLTQLKLIFVRTLKFAEYRVIQILQKSQIDGIAPSNWVPIKVLCPCMFCFYAVILCTVRPQAEKTCSSQKPFN